MNTVDTQARLNGIEREIETLKEERRKILNDWANEVNAPIKVGDVIPFPYGRMTTARVQSQYGATDGLNRLLLRFRVKPLRADGAESKGYAQEHQWRPALTKE